MLSNWRTDKNGEKYRINFDTQTNEFSRTNEEEAEPYTEPYVTSEDKNNEIIKDIANRLLKEDYPLLPKHFSNGDIKYVRRAIKEYAKQNRKVKKT